MSTRLKAIVSGANGFLGTTFMETFRRTKSSEALGLVRRDAGPGTVATDYSPMSLGGIFRRYQPEMIIHAAGLASVSLSIARPEKDRESSIGLVKSILSELRNMDEAPPFIYISSAAVYGNPAQQPVAEDSELAPISPYGEHRRECEKLIYDYVA